MSQTQTMEELLANSDDDNGDNPEDDESAPSQEEETSHATTETNTAESDKGGAEDAVDSSGESPGGPETPSTEEVDTNQDPTTNSQPGADDDQDSDSDSIDNQQEETSDEGHSSNSDDNNDADGEAEEEAGTGGRAKTHSEVSPDEGVIFEANAEARALESFLNAVGEICEEARMHVNENGIQVAMSDPANVAMIDIPRTDTLFESFEATEFRTGINVNRLEEIVSVGDKDDLVQLRIQPDSRKLHIRVDTLEFTVSLLDPDTIRTAPEIPDFDQSAEVILDAEDINYGLKAADMVSEHIELAALPEQDFEIRASGDTDDVNFTLDEEDCTKAPDVDEEVIGMFNLEYVNGIRRVFGGSANLTVGFANDFPMDVTGTLSDAEIPVSLMFAPRIQAD